MHPMKKIVVKYNTFLFIKVVHKRCKQKGFNLEMSINFHVILQLFNMYEIKLNWIVNVKKTHKTKKASHLIKMTHPDHYEGKILRNRVYQHICYHELHYKQIKTST